MLVCRAVSVEPKQVLTITLKNLLVKILNYLELSAVFAQMGSRIFHHSKLKT